MAKKPGKGPQAIRDRAARTAAAMATPGAAVQAPKKRTPPLQFLQEVRAEARKITWTSRRETWITFVMVAIMVTIAALFFWGVNSIISVTLAFILRVTTGG